MNAATSRSVGVRKSLHLELDELLDERRRGGHRDPAIRSPYETIDARLGSRRRERADRVRLPQGEPEPDRKAVAGASDSAISSGSRVTCTYTGASSAGRKHGQQQAEPGLLHHPRPVRVELEHDVAELVEVLLAALRPGMLATEKSAIRHQS